MKRCRLCFCYALKRYPSFKSVFGLYKSGVPAFLHHISAFVGKNMLLYCFAPWLRIAGIRVFRGGQMYDYARPKRYNWKDVMSYTIENYEFTQASFVIRNNASSHNEALRPKI